MVQDMYARQRRPECSSSGFTLAEILVALVVMGVAMTLIIWFLTASMDLSKDTRHERIATAYAQEQLTALTDNPSAYNWTLPADLSLGAVTPKNKAQSHLAPPSILPPKSSLAYDHESNFYDGFTWKAFAKLPALDATRVEVTVLVSWGVPHKDKQGNKVVSDRSITLTSSLPRAAVEGKA